MSTQEEPSSPVGVDPPSSAAEYPIPTPHEIRIVFSVIEHAEFKSNYHGVAEDMGFTNANSAQKKFKQIADAFGFKLVDGQILKKEDAPATTTRKGAPKGPRTPKSASASGGRKRKAVDEGTTNADDGNDGEEVEVKTPTTRKKRAAAAGNGANITSPEGEGAATKTSTPRKKKATGGAKGGSGKGTGRAKKQTKSEEAAADAAKGKGSAKENVGDYYPAAANDSDGDTIPDPEAADQTLGANKENTGEGGCTA